MGRSTVHYAENKTNNALKKLHNKLRPVGRQFSDETNLFGKAKKLYKIP